MFHHIGMSQKCTELFQNNLNPQTWDTRKKYSKNIAKALLHSSSYGFNVCIGAGTTFKSRQNQVYLAQNKSQYSVEPYKYTMQYLPNVAYQYAQV